MPRRSLVSVFGDQRLDVDDLLFAPDRGSAGARDPGRVARVAITVIGQRDRRGQHREDQGVHEQDATHGAKILPFPSSLVSTERCSDGVELCYTANQRTRIIRILADYSLLQLVRQPGYRQRGRDGLHLRTKNADEVGGEIEAYCPSPRCKADTTHTIISMYEDEVRRVQCVVCGEVHAYRKPRGDGDRGRRRRRRQARRTSGDLGRRHVPRQRHRPRKLPAVLDPRHATRKATLCTTRCSTSAS